MLQKDMPQPELNGKLDSREALSRTNYEMYISIKFVLPFKIKSYEAFEKLLTVLSMRLHEKHTYMDLLVEQELAGSQLSGHRRQHDV